MKSFKINRLISWPANHKVLSVTIGILGFTFLLVITVITILYYQSILPSDANFLGINLSCMNEHELDSVIKEQINSRYNNAELSVIFEDNILKIKANDYNFHFVTSEVFDAAKKADYKSGETPSPPIHYDDQKLSKTIQEFSDSTVINIKKYSYKEIEDELLVSAGSAGEKINHNEVKLQITDAMSKMNFDNISAAKESIIDDTIAINIEQIQQEVTHEAVNASYNITSSGKMQYTDSAIGVEFNLEDAKHIITDSNSGTYKIPLKITKPEVTVSSLKKEHDNASCPSVLSTYTTKFSQSDKDRNFNITKAAQSVNNTVLYPGERFSAIETIGSANSSQGYRESTIYTPDGTSKGAGGGVCQVSSTIYLAAVYGYMDILERHNHSYLVGYVPLGFDAAFSSGGVDLRFKNTRSSPIRIVAKTTTNSITINIMGTPSYMDEYKVTMNSATESIIPYETTEIASSDIPAGTKKVETNGQNGCVVIVHKTVTRNGEIISEENIKSNYKPLKKVVLVGVT